MALQTAVAQHLHVFALCPDIVVHIEDLSSPFSSYPNKGDPAWNVHTTFIAYNIHSIIIIVVTIQQETGSIMYIPIYRGERLSDVCVC